MRIGIPKETKTLEGRVALVPAAAAELVHHGHEVLVQHGAGKASGYTDADYERVGIEIAADAKALYDAAQLVVKVKEPLPEELPFLREDHLLFCYLHLAAIPDLARELARKGLTAVGWETVEEDGRLPLLQPMSAVAGCIAVQYGTTLLYRPNRGRGVMLGGLPTTERGKVVILGAGTVGSNAARVAAALGAQVTVFGINRTRMDAVHQIASNVTSLPSFDTLIEEYVIDADLVVGGVLLAGGRAPTLVSEEMVRRMKPGSVIMDVSIDQGGCVETIRPTLWDDPTFVVHDVVHFGVTNMPGAVPRTSAQALSTALTPFVLRLASPNGLDDPAIRAGINVANGQIVHPAVRAAVC
ncbi:MAG: alanine dehydrogenase [bacterium]|nr:alanine dehydrogenase [bacterium]